MYGGGGGDRQLIRFDPIRSAHTYTQIERENRRLT